MDNKVTFMDNKVTLFITSCGRPDLLLYGIRDLEIL